MSRAAARFLNSSLNEMEKEMQPAIGFQKTGIGVFDCLLLMFIYLKLTKQIDWSWFWVFSPFWAGLIMFFILLVLKGWLEETANDINDRR